MTLRKHNSTIKLKQKVCRRCGQLCYIFSRGRCATCSRIEDNADSAIGDDGEDLSGLIDDADAVFSKWVRYKDADERGNNRCYTCDVELPASQLHCGHFVPRIHMATRYMPGNCRPQCEFCNCHKRGNLAEYAKRLESESPGITEFLLSESRQIYKITREELRTIINEYTIKLKSLPK